MLPVSLLVIARNEAACIGRCLDSVNFVSEKLVIDAESTDGTGEIAAAHGARVVIQPWLGFGPQRNFATAHAAFDWILVLDADEEMTPALAQELQLRIPLLLKSKVSGAVLRRRTHFMGAPMHWYRPMHGEKIARLYHRSRARWTDARVHEHLEFDGPTTSFRHPFIHHHNPTLPHKRLKGICYTELKGRTWIERGRSGQLWACPLIFMSTFCRDYFLRLACLDGVRGAIVAYIAADQAVYQRLRHFEMLQVPDTIDLAQQLLRSHDIEP